MRACMSGSHVEPYLGQQLQLVRNQHNCLLLQQALDALVKDVLGGVLIHSRQRVVQQH
jgi:hypothetical protein